MTNRPTFTHILLNYLKCDPKEVADTSALLRRPRRADDVFPRAVYKHQEGDRLLEILALPDLSALGALIGDAQWRETEDALRRHLVADFRRQVHALRDVVKPSRSAVPTAPHLQLRRIEVPPRVFAEYHEWRRDTLFAHVAARPEVEAFAAYHSVISTEPGVLFVSEFSCPIDSYLASFRTPEYDAFVQYAAARFIAGGASSLHTSLWTRE